MSKTTVSGSVHVVSKADISKHTVVSAEAPSTPLEESSIRVQSHILSLTSNNVTYARLGSFLHWWSAYPVPSYLKVPYNSSADWGIVPAWGYATVVESRIDEVPVGSLVWGFWPLSTLPADLKLVKAKARARWTEVSESRKELMTLYNDYEVISPNVKESAPSKDELGWTSLAKGQFITALLINDFVFNVETQPPIPPLGIAEAQAWSTEDADLSKAVVVNLSAAGKTAQSVLWQLGNARKPGTGPLSALGIATTPSKIPTYDNLPSKNISYNEISESATSEWLRSQNATRVVIIDYGARGESISEIYAIAEKSFSKDQITLIGVGNSPEQYTPEEFQRLQARAAKFGALQSNMSAQRDAVMQRVGADKFHDDSTARWKEFLRKGSYEKVELKWGDGLKSAEDFWASVWEDKLDPNGLLVQL